MPIPLPTDTPPEVAERAQDLHWHVQDMARRHQEGIDRFKLVVVLLTCVAAGALYLWSKQAEYTVLAVALGVMIIWIYVPRMQGCMRVRRRLADLLRDDVGLSAFYKLREINVMLHVLPVPFRTELSTGERKEGGALRL